MVRREGLRPANGGLDPGLLGLGFGVSGFRGLGFSF